MVMVMVMVKCPALVRSHLIYLVVGSFGPVPSRVDRLHPLRPSVPLYVVGSHPVPLTTQCPLRRPARRPRAERVGGVLFGKPLLALGYGGWGLSAFAPPCSFIPGRLAVAPPFVRPSLRFLLAAHLLVPSLSTAPASLRFCFPRPRIVFSARSAFSVRAASGSRRIPPVCSFLCSPSVHGCRSHSLL